MGMGMRIGMRGWDRDMGWGTGMGTGMQDEDTDAQWGCRTGDAEWRLPTPQDHAHPTLMAQFRFPELEHPSSSI